MQVVGAETVHHMRARLGYERVQNALKNLANRWPEYQDDPIAQELVRCGYVVLESYLTHQVDQHAQCTNRRCRRRWRIRGCRPCWTHRMLSSASTEDLSTVWWHVLNRLDGHHAGLEETRTWLAGCATDDDG